MTSIDLSSHRKTFAFLFCSLDGYHEDPTGGLGWNAPFIDREFFDGNLRQNQSVGALLLGRRTYDHFAEFWPSPQATEHAPETAAFMNAVPKLVVTRGARLDDWSNARVSDGTDLAADLEGLRERTTGDVAVFGSSGLTASLLDQGVVDELRVLVHPVLLGAGTACTPG